MLGSDVTIIDVLAAISKFDMHHFGQSIAILDCLLLNNKLDTKWTVFQDYDEVMWLPKPGSLALEFLSDYGASFDALTFGNWQVKIQMCKARRTSARSYIDRMTKLQRAPACGVSCSDWRGKRKYAVQPTRIGTALLSIHNVHISPERVRVLTITEGYMRHFRKVLDLNASICGQELTASGSLKLSRKRHRKNGRRVSTKQV